MDVQHFRSTRYWRSFTKINDFLGPKQVENLLLDRKGFKKARKIYWQNSLAIFFDFIDFLEIYAKFWLPYARYGYGVQKLCTEGFGSAYTSSMCADLPYNKSHKN